MHGLKHGVQEGSTKHPLGTFPAGRGKAEKKPLTCAPASHTQTHTHTHMDFELLVFFLGIGAVVAALLRNRVMGRARRVGTAGFRSIRDNYTTIEALQADLRKSGLESSQVHGAVMFAPRKRVLLHDTCSEFEVCATQAYTAARRMLRVSVAPVRHGCNPSSAPRRMLRVAWFQSGCCSSSSPSTTHEATRTRV